MPTARLPAIITFAITYLQRQVSQAMVKCNLQLMILFVNIIIIVRFHYIIQNTVGKILKLICIKKKVI